MIEKNKFRKKRSRPSSKRPSAFKHSNGFNSPKTRVSITRALEKYISMAQDAHSNGDRIVAENFYQYAEHYQRLLNEVPPDNGSQEKANKNELNKKSDINLVLQKPSRTERAYSAKQDRQQKNENSEIKKKNFSDQNEEVSGDESSKNVTRDGIEALKPYEI